MKKMRVTVRRLRKNESIMLVSMWMGRKVLRRWYAPTVGSAHFTGPSFEIAVVDGVVTEFNYDMDSRGKG